MCRFALFVAIVIVASATCVLAQPPPPPPPPEIPDVNPELSKEASDLLNAVFPDLARMVAAAPILQSDYADYLQTFEEVVVRSDAVQQTRLGKEIRSRLINNPKIPEAKFLFYARTEGQDITLTNVALAADIAKEMDEDPKITDEMIQEGAEGVIVTLNLYVAGYIRRAINLIQEELVALVLMSYFTRRSGGGGGGGGADGLSAISE